MPEITIGRMSEKNARRFKRWVPFVCRSLAALRAMLPNGTAMPKEIILKAKQPRMTSCGVAMCMEWGRYGFGLHPGQMWISMDMGANSYKFRLTLIHEIAHIGADIAYCNNSHDKQWSELNKKLRKELSK